MNERLERLKKEADIGAVVKYLGLHIERRGSAYFIPCPFPDHEDSHPSAYYRDGWNNIYCTVCKRSMQAVDLIMQNRGCSFGEAADLLWDLSGRPDWYTAKPQNISDSFQLSSEELRFLGIQLPSRIHYPVMETQQKSCLKEEMRDYSFQVSTDYVMQKEVKVSWRDWLSETQFKQIVYQACCRKEKQLREMQKAFVRLGIPITFKNEKRMLADIRQRMERKGKRAAV